MAETENEDPIAMAAAKKAEGNLAYKSGRYQEAIRLYTNAIALDPQAAYYNNRAAANIMLLDHASALQDAKAAITKEPDNVKYHLRAGKCYLSLGRASDARRHFDQVASLDPDNTAVKADIAALAKLEQLEDRVQMAEKSGYWNNCISTLEQALEIAPSSLPLKLRLAEFYLKADKLGEADRIASGVLRQDGMHAEALYVRGMCMAQRGDLDQAAAHCRRGLQSNPDHTRARAAMKKYKKLLKDKEDATDAFKQGDYPKALELYQAVMAEEPELKLFNAKLKLNCAIVYGKLEQFEKGITMGSSALEDDPSYLKALKKRAELNLKQENYEDAVKDYEAAVEQEPQDRDLRGQLQHAKIELKKSKRKNYYKILSVSKDAGESEIKRAYKKSALQHHPDRVPAEQKEEAEAQFKEIGEAYAILSDPGKKMRYDRGEDLDEQSGPSHANVNDMFSQMFAGGGGFQFGGGRGGRGGGFGGHPHFGGGFPGFHQGDDDDNDEYY